MIYPSYDSPGSSRKWKIGLSGRPSLNRLPAFLASSRASLSSWTMAFQASCGLSTSLSSMARVGVALAAAQRGRPATVTAFLCFGAG